MGRSLFKKTRKRPTPEGAEIIQKRGKTVARWTDGHGNRKEAPVTQDGLRVLLEAETYTGRYRASDGQLVEFPTGARTQDVAAAILRERELREEKISAGVFSQGEADAADWAAVPLADHLEAYVRAMTAKGRTHEHVKATKLRILRVSAGCEWKRLQDIDPARMQRWIEKRADAGTGARAINADTIAVKAFVNWLRKNQRMLANPLIGIERVDERSDRRHVRRPLEEAEIGRLLDSATHRPLADNRINRGGQAEPKPKTIERLTALGRERALCYRLMIELGLRAGEVRGLRIGDLNLDTHSVTIRPELEKARRGAELPLPADLSMDIAQHHTERLKAAQSEAQANGRPIPVRLDLAAIAFPNAPAVKTLDRDMRHAGIEKQTRVGVIDLHSLRHTCATRLAQRGVHPATAQKILRHATVQMTLGVYTHANMGDLRLAVESARPSEREAVAHQVAIASQFGSREWVDQTDSGDNYEASNTPTSCPPIFPPLDRKTVHFPATPCASIGQPPSSGIVQQINEKPQENTVFLDNARGEDWRALQRLGMLPCEIPSPGLAVERVRLGIFIGSSICVYTLQHRPV